MKNLVTISLIIFMVVVVGILGATVFTKQSNTNNVQMGATNNINQPGITLAQVASHNSEGDCWVIVNGNVYNVTNLIPMHSGGAETIIPYCGKDGSLAFNTKNGNGPHSQRAQNMMSGYYVGILKP